MSALQVKAEKLLCLLRKSRKTILLIATVAAITLATSTLAAILLNNTYDLCIPSLGTIRLIGVEAYGGDINQTNSELEIYLGEIQVGTPKNISFILRNKSNTPTTLSMTANNWKPQNLATYMSVSWNYTGNQIAPNQEIHVRIDIDAPTTMEFANYLITNNVESFSFSLTIKANET